MIIGSGSCVVDKSGLLGVGNHPIRAFKFNEEWGRVIYYVLLSGLYRDYLGATVEYCVVMQ